MTKYIVLSLGEILQENRDLALAKFCEYVSDVEKKPIIDKLVALLRREELASHGCITQFKLGLLKEQDFIVQMCGKILQDTGVALSEVQFKTIWNSKHPNVAVIKQNLLALGSAKTRLAQQGYVLLLVSYTNPLDMQYLVTDCKNTRYSLFTKIKCTL